MWLRMDHMGPFMDLICHQTQNYCKNKRPFIYLSNCIIRSYYQSYTNKQRHWITRARISLDKPMSSDILGIDVMHPKCAYERWAKNWCFKAPPSVTTPMQEPSNKINKELRNDKTRKYINWVAIIVGYCIENQFQP